MVPHACPRASAALLAALLSLIPTEGWAQEGIREEVRRPEPKLTRPPQLLSAQPAVYPEDAQAEGIEGAVKMQVTLDTTGKVTDVTVLATPDPRLAAAAVAAVKEFTFSPAEVDGKPAPVRIQYTYNFTLDLKFNPRLPDWMRERKVEARGEAPLVGRVREQGSRIPLPGVAVALPELGIEVKADARGRFEMTQVPPGTYSLKALSPEHKPETIEVEVEEGQQTQIDFYLPPLAENPYEIVVRGTRRETVVTRVTLKEKELTTVPGTFGDPVRVVENLPGVARLPYVGGGLLIRGAPPGDSGVYLDGVEIPILYHFLGGPSVLNPAFLDRIDYYPGNVDVRYGRLTAGVVDVTTRSAATEQIGGSVDINLLNTSVLLKVPVTKQVTVSGAVRRSYIDAILPSILELSDREATTVVPIYYDYQLRVDVDLDKDDRMFVLVFGSDDSLDIATNEPEDPVEASLDSRISFHRVLAQWRWQVSDTLTSRLTPSAGVNYISFQTGGQAGVTLRTLDFALREDLELKLDKRARVRFGVDMSLSEESFDALVPVPADYRNPGVGVTNPFTVEAQDVYISQLRLGLGLYADVIWDVTDRLQAIPGVRGEIYRFFGDTLLSVEPRLTTRYKLTDKTILKAAAGMYSRLPDPADANEEFGNPDLGLERAAHFSLGGERKLLPALNLDAQLYYIHRYNRVVPTDRVRFDGEKVRPLRYRNAGGGYSYGLEVMLKHDVTRHFYGWLAYTLSRTRVQREEGGDYVPFTFDQTHILTAVGSVRLGVGWELGARFRLVSGRPDTPILGGVLDSDINRYSRITGAFRSERLPLFHQLDVRVEKTWIFDWWRLSIYLDVQNVYNAENPEATLFDYRFEESAPLRGLPILPTLGVKGSF